MPSFTPVYNLTELPALSVPWLYESRPAHRLAASWTGLLRRQWSYAWLRHTRARQTGTPIIPTWICGDNDSRVNF
jgi:hypothetical protein